MTADGQKWTKFSVELSGPAKNEVLLQSQCYLQQTEVKTPTEADRRTSMELRKVLNGLYTAKGNLSQFKG